MIRTINKMIAPLRRGIKLAVSRGTIKLVDDGTKMQTAQLALLDGEVRDGVEIFQQYGFSSVPLADSEAVVVAVGNNRDHLVVIAHGDRRSRPVGLPAGAVAMYHPSGMSIVMTATGIAINGGDRNVTVTNSPQVVVTGGDVIADGISLKHHKHPIPGGMSEEAV